MTSFGTSIIAEHTFSEPLLCARLHAILCNFHNPSGRWVVDLTLRLVGDKVRHRELHLLGQAYIAGSL